MLRARAAATFVLMLFVAGTAEAQYELPLIGVDIELSDYGLAGSWDVVRGRVSVAYGEDGPTLGVYYLRDTPPGPRRAVGSPDVRIVPGPTERGAPRERQTALWVWNTRELLDDRVERDTFLDFIEEQWITRVFLYLPAARGEDPEAGFIPFDGGELGPLLAELRERGALAYALDGDRYYARRENHAGVYRTVERLVAHNRSVPVEQRFHGIRYDIEPYLVPGFQGPERQDLLNGYVELIAGVANRARLGNLEVAVDIPFWFDAPDEETGLYMEADLGGERRRVIDHVMTLVDDVAIMDYRTSAEGPNGALVHAQGELVIGGTTGVGVFVGVETTRLLDEDLHTFFGQATEGLPTSGDSRWIVLEGRAEGKARLWVVDSEEALAELRRSVRGATDLRHWPAGRPARVAADTQSFHALGRESMEEVTGELLRRFAGRPAFLGLAFHDYLGLRELVRRD